MSLEFVPSDYFATELKRLAKRYRGLADDYEAFLDSLKENPLQGTEIAPKIRKIRMPITAKGRASRAVLVLSHITPLLQNKRGKYTCY